MIDLGGLQKVTTELAKEVTTELAKEVESISKNKVISTPVLDIISLIFDNIKSQVAIVDNNYRLIYFNKSAKDFVKKNFSMDLVLGNRCYSNIFGINTPCVDCKVLEAMKTKRMQINIWEGAGKKFYQTCIPLRINGISGVIEILEEINEQ